MIKSVCINVSHPWQWLEFYLIIFPHLLGLNLCHLQPCKNNGRCTVKGHTYQCTCNNGWTGVNCETKVIKDQVYQ